MNHEIKIVAQIQKWKQMPQETYLNCEPITNRVYAVEFLINDNEPILPIKFTHNATVLENIIGIDGYDVNVGHMILTQDLASMGYYIGDRIAIICMVKQYLRTNNTYDYCIIPRSISLYEG